MLVISQDTSAYGVDVNYRPASSDGRAGQDAMTELVQELAELRASVPGCGCTTSTRIRTSTRCIPLMAEGKVLPYLDVPFQHSHPRILKLMKRPASGEKNIERIRAWREICPDLTIRSTFIAGFPGETEAEFEHLLDFLEEAQLDRVGCFAYSPVEGAAANELPGALPDEVREERRARFMEVQAKISAQRLERYVGTHDARADRRARGDRRWHGRRRPHRDGRARDRRGGAIHRHREAGRRRLRRRRDH